ncbi:YraN family protein [Litorivicinus lipolyticus]|uniref:UPF0102 protein GH975_10395 n=1 Tax=Litorivicinus lipolyticus TaxID=418701 RepID=A0A5Q2QG07_9GAMM|nr:YraN family protein [Litorivicinus lipolyticus]QGG80956.1 YraN family protein [Litorivicinus lipolyticus]
MSDRQARGLAAENWLIGRLANRRVQLRHHRYGCRLGEIDLVLEDPDHIVMVEVRYRSSLTAAIQSIDWHKRRRLKACAYVWLANNPTDKVIRFDTVGISGTPPNWRLRWIPHAFEMDD